MNKLYEDYEKFPIRYANCWEDSENLLRTAPEHARILSICSGGDNTLALLLKHPQEILAFDTNIYQIYLAQLKICAIQHLDYSEVLILLGINSGDAYNIFQKLKGKLSPAAFQFFSKHPEFFRRGIINVGKFEHYFQLFAKHVCPLFASKKTLRAFANQNHLAEQRELYLHKINNRRLNILFNIFFGFKAMGKFGRDKNYYNHISDNDKQSNARDIKQRFDYGVTHIINQTNPYLNYILLNSFNESCLPDYLKPENYRIIKQNLSKIKFLQGSLLDVKDKYDYFNLSDIFEYMSPADYAKNLQHLSTIADKNASIVYYNMQSSHYIDEGRPEFQKLASASAEGFQKNRAYFYRDFLVYRKVTDE